jgi:hypothetical protein
MKGLEKHHLRARDNVSLQLFSQHFNYLKAERGALRMNVQALFYRYNRRYWRGRLPLYKVVLTDKYVGGRCEKQQRIIYINPSTTGPISRTLLHEMIHAAVRGNGHGRTFQDEMNRLCRLGAPLRKELDMYVAGKVFGEAHILAEFYDIGGEAEDTVTWAQVRGRLGYEYGFLDKEGHAPNTYSARFLQKARRQFLRGRSDRRSFREGAKETSQLKPSSETQLLE